MRPHGASSKQEVLDKIEEHRSDLEALAETDLPAADWAGYFLAVYERETSSERKR